MKLRDAFTLIELLVVIAIIAILAAILFPVFAQAKVAAKKTVSLSNVKQLALASIMYATDSDDRFVTPPEPTDQNGYGWKLNWQILTIPYIKNLDIFDCPGNDNASAPTESWDVDDSGRKNPRFGYVANGVVAARVASSWEGWDMIGVINANHNWFLNRDSRTTTEIGLPSATIMFATRYRLHPQTSARYDSVFSPWMSVMIGADGFDQRSMPGVPNGTWGAIDPSYDGTISNVFAGKSPFAFADGHAASLKPSRTIFYDPAIPNGGWHTPYYHMWDATRTE